MSGGWDEGRRDDWGASEVHDWGGEAAAPSGLADGVVDLAPGVPDRVDPDDRGEGGGRYDEDDEDDDPIASYVELAMENLRRTRAHPDAGEEEEPLYCFGSGDDGLYAIDDGPGRVMVGRAVGQDDDDCVYCLVGTGPAGLLDALDAGEVPLAGAFDDVTELHLCSVFAAAEVENVVLVQRYDALDDVPVEYRPGRPFLRFTDD